MIIREVSIADVDDLEELYLKHLTTNPPHEPQLKSDWTALMEILLQNRDYHILVSEEDGKVVSSVTVIIIKNLTHNLRPYAIIENVVTHNEYRGRGYASALLEYASEFAKRENCYKIMLMTGSKLESTLNFYEKNGFNRGEKTAFIKRF